MTVQRPSRRSFLRTGFALATLVVAAAPLIPPAMAQDLAAAKDAGLLGERIDGYVGVVKAAAPPEVRALAEEINAERRAQYAEIAERRDVPTQAVAQIAGQKLLDRADPGDWILGADGQWRQK